MLVTQKNLGVYQKCNLTFWVDKLECPGYFEQFFSGGKKINWTNNKISYRQVFAANQIVCTKSLFGIKRVVTGWGFVVFESSWSTEWRKNQTSSCSLFNPVVTALLLSMVILHLELSWEQPQVTSKSEKRSRWKICLSASRSTPTNETPN